MTMALVYGVQNMDVSDLPADRCNGLDDKSYLFLYHVAHFPIEGPDAGYRGSGFASRYLESLTDP
jgi:hypothetical protein